MTGALLVVAALALLLAACQPSAAASPAASAAQSVEAVELTVLGAASLHDALTEIEVAYEAAVPGNDLVIATDSSAALRTQIEEGLPADVFLSADIANPQALRETGLTSGDPVPYAGNRLALVVPTDNPAGIESPADLAAAVQIIAAGPGVPITSYVAEVVANLAALSDYPAGFADAYAANVVSEEDNVRGVLTKIELGEGDAGFVYQTDAQSSSEVLAVEIPEGANTHAVYAACAISDSDNLDAAEAFLAWLAGPGGQGVLAEFGFTEP